MFLVSNPFVFRRRIFSPRRPVTRRVGIEIIDRIETWTEKLSDPQKTQGDYEYINIFHHYFPLSQRHRIVTPTPVQDVSFLQVFAVENFVVSIFNYKILIVFPAARASNLLKPSPWK